MRISLLILSILSVRESLPFSPPETSVYSRPILQPRTARKRPCNSFLSSSFPPPLLFLPGLAPVLPAGFQRLFFLFSFLWRSPHPIPAQSPHCSLFSPPNLHSFLKSQTAPICSFLPPPSCINCPLPAFCKSYAPSFIRQTFLAFQRRFDLPRFLGRVFNPSVSPELARGELYSPTNSIFPSRSRKPLATSVLSGGPLSV